MKITKIMLCTILFALQPVNADDVTDLFAAATRGKLQRVEALLADGVDVNAKTGSGRTALMGASFNGNVRVVKYLLSYGADVNQSDNAGVTPLMDAVMFGSEEIVKLLITAGADVNAQDNSNTSVLARAKKTPHKPIVKILETAIESETTAAAKKAPAAPAPEEVKEKEVSIKQQ